MNYEEVQTADGNSDQTPAGHPEHHTDLADEDQPEWAPPESQPEPRPTEPEGDMPPSTSILAEVNPPA